MAAEIQIANLVKAYPNGTQALKGVSLEIEKGQCFALLGPNGAGKSTMVGILTTLVDTDAGNFTIAGIQPQKDAGPLQKIIGVASQDNELDPVETAENLLVFQGRLFGMDKALARERASELIHMFSLSDERKKKAGALSGGNKRRLHCALALMQRPRVLFLDEPTVGMDPHARAKFWEVITQLNREEGVTVFLTTQYLEEAEKHASSMALLINGQIKYAGSISGFKNLVNPAGSLSLDESYLAFTDCISADVSIS